ncbi:MAG: FAD-binding oxidoreductase, partial [Chloroflexota bacterium]
MLNVPSLSHDQIKFLQSIVGEEFVSAKNADLDQHSRDQSFHQAHLPAVVVWPSDTQQVSKVVKFANENLIPVTAWGAGTSIEGNPIPVCGGIVLDVSRMDKILKLYKEDFQVDVQPGIKYKDMNAVLSKQGLFYAPDPGA